MTILEDSVRGGAAFFSHKGAWQVPDSAVRDTRRAEYVDVPYPRNPVIGFLSPPAIYAAVVEHGAEKARQPWWKTFWLGILAGVYLSLGGAFSYSVGGQLPQLMQSNPGLQKLIFAGFGLPLGLGLIIICGAELYTTNAAWLPAALYEGRANFSQLAKNWICSYLGNLAGSLIVVWLVYETYLFESNSAETHVIANMFWVPFAIKLGAPISVGRYIVHSMIPDFIGNTIVAAFFLAGSYAFCYGTLSDRCYRRWLKLRGKDVENFQFKDSYAQDVSAHRGKTNRQSQGPPAAASDSNSV
ncbi:hypothetical protein WJX73_002446 [Symbiochloris irregularis]|uniref:Formate/nitrite transporter n=1 Tax=Symbiochloris irregularis TaxID=706552 RepID=A0AAW1NSC5_9CHLO